MAKFKPGPLAAQISGSVLGSTFSRNRYGPYIRGRVIPVKSTTQYALNAKARFAGRSQFWQVLTEAQRLSWNSWSADHPMVDRLGDQQQLHGQAAYIGINTRLEAAGLPVIVDPPLVPAPPPLTLLTQTADIGTGDFALVFTPTPLQADEYLWIQAALIDSSGITYVKNRLRFLGIGAGADTSPFDHQALVEGRFGTAIVGQSCHVLLSVFCGTTGLLSPPLKTSSIVLDTP